MSIFDELEAQYDEIDNQYTSIEFEARTKSWNNKEQKYQRKREINDQAYFLFMFSRLEDRIRTQSAALIKKNKLLSSHGDSGLLGIFFLQIQEMTTHLKNGSLC